MIGGEDDGEILFVGRANHEGAVIPGKVKNSHGVCYIPYGGEEHGKNEYQVSYQLEIQNNFYVKKIMLFSDAL